MSGRGHLTRPRPSEQRKTTTGASWVRGLTASRPKWRVRGAANLPATDPYGVGGASRAGCAVGVSFDSLFGDSIPYRRILS